MRQRDYKLPRGMMTGGGRRTKGANPSTAEDTCSHSDHTNHHLTHPGSCHGLTRLSKVKLNTPTSPSVMRKYGRGRTE